MNNVNLWIYTNTKTDRGSTPWDKWGSDHVWANRVLFINKHFVQCDLPCSKWSKWTCTNMPPSPPPEINPNVCSSDLEPVGECPTSHSTPWFQKAESTWDLQDQAPSHIHSYQMYSEGLSARSRGMQPYCNRAIALGTSTEAASKGCAFTLNQSLLPLD